MTPDPNNPPVNADRTVSPEALASQEPEHVDGLLTTFDTPPPHAARIYNYWLGGKDNFAADRQIGQQIAALAPWVRSAARGNRAFLTRAVTHLAKAGISQFLDLGTGLPSAGNVHEVAQAVNPAARVVYVDNDDLVLVHARALLACDPLTAAVHGDLREPEAILADPMVRRHLDFTQPIAVLFLAILHFIVDQDLAPIITHFRDALTPGSYLAISQAADLPDSQDRAAATREAATLYNALAAPFTLRTGEQITNLFTGFTILQPGIVPAHLWRPTRRRLGTPVPLLAGIGLLPDTSATPAEGASTR